MFITSIYWCVVPDYEKNEEHDFLNCDEQVVNNTDGKTENDFDMENSKTSFLTDIRCLAVIKSSIFTSLGAAASGAINNTITIWFQEDMRRLLVSTGNHEACIDDFFIINERNQSVYSDDHELTSSSGKILCVENGVADLTLCDIHLAKNCTSPTISSTYGVVSIVAGITGVLLGVYFTKKMLNRYQNAGSLVACYGQVLACITLTVQGGSSKVTQKWSKITCFESKLLTRNCPTCDISGKPYRIVYFY